MFCLLIKLHFVRNNLFAVSRLSKLHDYVQQHLERCRTQGSKDPCFSLCPSLGHYRDTSLRLPEVCCDLTMDSSHVPHMEFLCQVWTWMYSRAQCIIYQVLFVFLLAPFSLQDKMPSIFSCSGTDWSFNSLTKCWSFLIFDGDSIS